MELGSDIRQRFEDRQKFRRERAIAGRRKWLWPIFGGCAHKIGHILLRLRGQCGSEDGIFSATAVRHTQPTAATDIIT
jgi:hypothetical protein